MLSASPLRSSVDDRRGGGEGGDVKSFSIGSEENLCGGNFLDDISFDDLFVGMEDVDLPDLELDPEMFAELSSVEDPEVNVSSSSASASLDTSKEEKGAREMGPAATTTTLSVTSHGDRGRRPGSSSSSAQIKGSHGKRKVKVDWTPELHKRFVQAVEQLGVDKAVPSRILELMGIDCLTRHNIASHLQKYRSHRKHLLAREAEAASWSQRRQVYGGKRDMAPWPAPVPPPAPPPTLGFPPPTALQPFRPLHVWGHPTVDQSLTQVWPKHLIPTSSPLPWVPSTPPLPPPSRPYWTPHQQRGSKDGWVPNHLTQGTPCYPQPLAATRFSAPPVTCIPPQVMYKVNNIHFTPPQSDSRLHIDFHPSKESIDAAIGDVLAKPWLPLPLGLKPPSVCSVLHELHQQGISKIPPSRA